MRYLHFNYSRTATVMWPLRDHVACKKICFPLMLILCCLPTVSWAQEQRAPVRFGESQFFPSLRIEIDRTDNAFRRSDTELDDTGFILKPSVDWLADRKTTELSASFEGDFRSADVGDTDYVDAKLGFGAKTRFNSRNAAEATLDIDFGHQELGTRFTRFDPFNNDQTTFRDIRWRGSYTFGAARARLNVTGGLALRSFEYTNNDALTDSSSFSSVRPFAELSTRLSGDSRGFWRISVDEQDFELDNITEVSTGLGFVWDTTGKSGGRIFAGANSQSSDVRDDDTSAVLSATVWWLPVSFSRFEIDLQRDFLDTELIGSNEQPVIDSIELTWTHKWSTRVSHLLNVNYDSIDRICPNDDNETLDISFEVGVSVRRWIKFGLGAQFESQDTSSCSVAPTFEELDYDRSSGFGFIEVSL